MPERLVSCGVIVTDGARLVLGHATGSPRWDIPKGAADRGETETAAAIRELREETGLIVDMAALVPAGRHHYLPSKDLALFFWRPETMPDPAALRCTALVLRPGRAPMPEFDRFGLFRFDDALGKVGRNMARVLSRVLA